jgi:hypothetical protein
MSLDAHGWTIVITGTVTALVAVLPQIANFIRQVRADRLAQESRQHIFEKVDSTANKIDDLKTQTDGVTSKLVAVTARASYAQGVEAQKDTQNAADGQQRREGDQPVVPK